MLLYSTGELHGPRQIGCDAAAIECHSCVKDAEMYRSCKAPHSAVLAALLCGTSIATASQARTESALEAC